MPQKFPAGNYTSTKQKGRTDLQGRPSWWHYSGDPLTATEADRKDFDRFKARMQADSANFSWKESAAAKNNVRDGKNPFAQSK